MRDHSPVGLVLLVSAALLLAPIVGTVVVSAAPVENETYAVAQGTSCTVVDPVVNESQNATAFYDYRNPDPNITGNPASGTYSSFGTTEYQETHTSTFLIYEGSDHASLVVVNGRLGDEAGGSTLTMTFDGLPADGEWVVEDDEYPNRDDNWEIGETSTTVDWKWGANRTDGGVYSGVGNFSGTITVTPAFNEEAAAWGDWGYSGSDQYRVESWRVLGADGTEVELDRDRQLFIHGGGCEVTPPTAALTGPNTAEAGQNVTLDASDTVDDGTLGGYEWDLDGDGETDRVTTDPTLDHAFADAGNYSVAVTAFDTYGNGDTAALAVNVTQPATPPTAVLDAPTQVTVNDSVEFDASASTDDDGSIVAYEWDFDGDGTVDNITRNATTQYVYEESGSFEATVTVVDDDDQRDTASQAIDVLGPNQPPNASLDAPETVDEGQELTLDASASTDDRDIAGFEWDFDGDGDIDSQTDEPTIAHTYEDPGNYTAVVTVIDTNGSTDRANASIRVRDIDEQPTAVLSGPEDATVNETVTFDASGSSDDRGIESYRWDFDDDGTVDATTNVSTVQHSYNATATDVTVRVTVVDTANQTATDTTTLDVEAPNEPPNATLDAPTNATAGDPVTFDASASTDDRGIESYRWDFDGDGTTDANTTAPTVEHTFETADTYDVAVTVVDTDGEPDTATATTTVVEPDASLSVVLNAPETATVNESVTLEASVSGGGDDDESSDVEGYEWDFDGDGTVDTETEAPTVQHTFTDAGSVTVGVTVIGDDGDTANASSTLVVGDPSAANTSIAVTTSEPTAGEPVSFEADATAATTITGYAWQFGDGAAGSGASAQHTYANAGSYEVTLELTTAGGVTTSATTTVTVAEAETDTGNGGDGNDGSTGGGGDDGADTGDGNNAGGGQQDGGQQSGGQQSGGQQSGGQQSGGQQGGSQQATPEPEADIGSANVSLATDRLLTGETLVVQATVRNDGDATGTKTVELEVEGELIEERRLTIPPGVERTVTFRYQFDSPGEKSVEVDRGRKRTVVVEAREPNLTVSALQVDKQRVATGESFTLSATVTNDGTAPGNRTVALELFGERVATKNVSVPVGESVELTFSRSVMAPGSYEATVGNQSVTVEVVGSGTTETTTITDTEAPGFGAVTAALTLALAGALLALRRRD